MLSFAEWQRLATVPNFGRLLAPSGLRDGGLPERDRTPLRDIDCADTDKRVMRSSANCLRS